MLRLGVTCCSEVEIRHKVEQVLNVQLNDFTFLRMQYATYWLSLRILCFDQFESQPHRRKTAK